MSASSSSLHRRGTSAGVVLLLALGCGDGVHDGRDARSAHAEADASTTARRIKPRTVSIELFRTTERGPEQAADGSFRDGALADLDGVEICAAKQRPAFASFQPFMDVDPPRCATSLNGQTVLLSSVPANADLVITLAKDGYRPGTMTFRTDDNDVAAPAWGLVSNELSREGAVQPWLELQPRASPGNAVVSISALAVWGGAAISPSVTQLSADEVLNVTRAQGANVVIEDAEGLPVRELSTLHERPLFVSLPEGSYAFRFSHPRMNMRPVGATAQYLIVGLSTAELDTIEVPVLAGHNAGAAADALCRAQRWDQAVDDLATCTLAAVGDAGAR